MGIALQMQLLAISISSCNNITLHFNTNIYLIHFKKEALITLTILTFPLIYCVCVIDYKNIALLYEGGK